MNRIIVQLDMTTSAFRETGPEEAARILRRLADYVEGYWCDFRFNEGAGLMDMDANRCGFAKLEEIEQ